MVIVVVAFVVDVDVSVVVGRRFLQKCFTDGGKKIIFDLFVFVSLELDFKAKMRKSQLFRDFTFFTKMNFSLLLQKRIARFPV